MYRLQEDLFASTISEIAHYQKIALKYRQLQFLSTTRDWEQPHTSTLPSTGVIGNLLHTELRDFSAICIVNTLRQMESAAFERTYVGISVGSHYPFPNVPFGRLMQTRHKETTTHHLVDYGYLFTLILFKYSPTWKGQGNREFVLLFNQNFHSICKKL